MTLYQWLEVIDEMLLDSTGSTSVNSGIQGWEVLYESGYEPSKAIELIGSDVNHEVDHSIGEWE
jgi:hypothetical protein|tara:strand:+ start:202 stop:393 length:192 start_codon:yes stop_codon:yes gene_type:complete